MRLRALKHCDSSSRCFAIIAYEAFDATKPFKQLGRFLGEWHREQPVPLLDQVYSTCFLIVHVNFVRLTGLTPLTGPCPYRR